MSFMTAQTLDVKRRGVVAILVSACAFVLAGCVSVGPATVARDRFDYNGEVARSWKEQMLLNIVKSRYLDTPVFLEISQIVSGYTLQDGVSLGGSTGGPTSQGLAVSVQGSFSDRPTITYTPLTGAQFNRNMLTPIPPSAILFTMASGWRVDLVFRITVRSINSIDSTGSDSPRYDRLLSLLRQLQLAGAVGMRVPPGNKNSDTVLLVFSVGTLTPEQQAMRKEVREILGLPQDQNEFSVVFGEAASRPGEIAMQTRSMMQVLLSLGALVDVPESDVREGRTSASEPATTVSAGMLHIKFSKDRPSGALASVAYRNGWYWIDDRDLQSKATFGLVMLLSTLAETGGRENLPLVTIPAG